MPANDLLARYLDAIRRHLGNGASPDLLAELAANLQAEMDDRAAELGRPLTEDDQAAILRRHGPPLLVAARYQPQRSLIGPEVFPFYLYALRRLLPLVLGINLLAQVVVLAFTDSATPLGQRLHPGAMLHDLIWAGIVFIGVVTAAFAILEATGSHWRPHLQNVRWDPRKLQRVQAVEPGGPRHPYADVIAGTLFLAWLLAFPHYSVLLFGPFVALRQFSLLLPPIWHTFYWALVGFNVVHLAMRCAMLAPSLRRYYPVVDAIQHLLGIGLIILFLRPSTYFTASGKGALSPDQIATINTTAHHVLVLTLILAVARFLWEMSRYVQPVFRLHKRDLA